MRRTEYVGDPYFELTDANFVGNIPSNDHAKMLLLTAVKMGGIAEITAAVQVTAINHKMAGLEVSILTNSPQKGGTLNGYWLMLLLLRYHTDPKKS